MSESWVGSVTTRDVRDAYRLTVEDTAAALSTDARRGLTDEEARARLQAYGRNELTVKRRVPAWRRFVAQFTNTLVVLLLVGSAVSVVAWRYEHQTPLPYEAIAILAVVLLNAAMGYIQESRSEAALTALRAVTANTALVVRDGEARRIPAADVVPGDVLVVEAGDRIAADARVAVSTALRTVEAPLTGESLPRSKETRPIAAGTPIADRDNMLFGGTAVAYGRGVAVVTATGMRSEFGRIATVMQTTTDQPTALQRELARTGRVLAFIVVLLALAIMLMIVFSQSVHGATALVDVLILGVALAVGAVPEGLPAIVTAVFAIGVRRMARRNAIVRRLAAVETLGSASVIASDKTGTFTKNELTVRAIVTASGRIALTGTGYTPTGDVQCEGRALENAHRLELERALTIGDRANNAVLSFDSDRWVVHGDPLEGALLVAARKAGVQSAALDTRLPRIAEIPFSSERKLMTTVHLDRERDEARIVCVKGAPDVVLAHCSSEFVAGGSRVLTAARRAEIERAIGALADEALRVLGVASRELPGNGSGDILSTDAASVEDDLVFAGVIGMIDPPRDEAVVAVQRATRAGIRTIMITGDHPRTAFVIARELGIPTDGRVLTGAEVTAMSDAELGAVVGKIAVYARIDPLDKLRIVRALQRNGEIVAMTGDGVNDAPALKAADIGVAMGIAGTDVAKEAADIVLTDDNFASIVAAVEEGRAIFANIRSFLRYLLSSNIGEVLAMVCGVMLGPWLGLGARGGELALPLLATQILWINLVTDGPPALALGLEPLDESVVSQPPRPLDERVIPARMWIGIIAMGVVEAVATLVILDASLPGGLISGTGNVAHAQTMVFTTLVLASLFNVFNARSGKRSAFHALFRNRALWGTIVLSLGLQLIVLEAAPLQRAFGTVSLGTADWARCVVAASAVLWMSELAKLAWRFRSSSS